jgi:lysozyme family protein
MIDSIINDLLLKEGGFVDHPADKGGPTNHGVTMATLALWRGKDITVEDVKLLTQDEARAIYRQKYIIEPGFFPLPDPLRGLMVDCGVNHGPSRAIRWLQKAIGVAEDGKIGPHSEKAIANSDPGKLYRLVLADRCRFYGRLITDEPKQAVFAAGWMNRAATFIAGTP